MPSETDSLGHTRTDLPDALIRAQLERILGSEIFSRSGHLRRFLSYIVEQTLAGQGQSLKESVIAHELYGKGAAFDGGTDPVVRVDARRLRDKLREYYDGRSDPVVISLPKGSYVPAFEAGASSTAPPPAPPPPQELQPAEKLERRGMAVGTLAIATTVVIAAAVVAGVVAWRVYGTTDAPPRLLPLVSYPGVETAPALSPDGNLIAFAWPGDAENGPTDIYVKAVETEALRRLTATTASETSPAWSPDGQSIAFVRDAKAVLIMSQNGGAERQVSGSGTHVVWAGDSKSVLIRDRDGGIGPFGIYQVFVDTLERRRLTQAPVGDGDWRFEVSPDGKRLAFIRFEKRGIADLYVMPMQGGDPRRLSNWGAPIRGLSWTPDGREIVYSVDEPAADRLWRIDANIGQPGRGSPIADIPAAAVNPSISRPMPGRPIRLAFQSTARDVDLQMIDLEAAVTNAGTALIESKPFLNSTRIEGSARFSADGSRIAFLSIRSGNPEIWVAGRDGSKLQQITSLGGTGLIVCDWSPDGARIAFEAAVEGNTDVYLVGADGGQPRRLTTEPSIDGVPSWSVDGQWIYFASTRAGFTPDIWRVSPNGGQATRLTHNGGFEGRESWDGRFLFYLDRAPAGVVPDGSARLMRMPVAGGQEEVVIDRVRPFLWSIAETGIVFIAREPEFDAIDVYRFSDRRTVRVGRLGFRLPGSYPHLTVSRDGRWALATKQVRFESDLMLLDNFR
jgi:Tol biopolymer transport system component